MYSFKGLKFNNKEYPRYSQTALRVQGTEDYAGTPNLCSYDPVEEGWGESCVTIGNIIPDAQINADHKPVRVTISGYWTPSEGASTIAFNESYILDSADSFNDGTYLYYGGYDDTYFASRYYITRMELDSVAAAEYWGLDDVTFGFTIEPIIEGDSLPDNIVIQNIRLAFEHEMTITHDDIKHDGQSVLGGSKSDSIVLSEDEYVEGESSAASQLAIQRSLKAIAGEHYDETLDLHGVLVENLAGMTDCTVNYNAHCVDGEDNKMDFACYAILSTPDDTSYEDCPISVTLSDNTTITGTLSSSYGSYTYTYDDDDTNVFASVAVHNSDNENYVQAMGIQTSTQVLIINAKPIVR